VAEVDQPAVVVCDAGPLIHLEELGCLDLLRDFRDILVPDAVWNEVSRHRPSALRRRRVRLNRVHVNAKPEGQKGVRNQFQRTEQDIATVAARNYLPPAIVNSNA
jgi:hypothetical protein